MNEFTQINVILRAISSQVIPNAAQQHTISQPAAIQTLPIGTILSGNIVGKEPKGGGFFLKTPKGEIFISTELPMLIGSRIELIIEQAGDNVRAKILTIDGKTPAQLLAPEGEQDELVIAKPGQQPQDSEPLTYSRNFRAAALAEQARRALEIIAGNVTSENEVQVQIEKPLTERINFLKTQLPPKLAEALNNILAGAPLKIKLLPDISTNMLKEAVSNPLVIDLESIKPEAKTETARSVPVAMQPMAERIAKGVMDEMKQIPRTVIESIIEENASQVTDDPGNQFAPKPAEKTAGHTVYSIGGKEAFNAIIQSKEGKPQTPQVITPQTGTAESIPVTNSKILLSGNTLYIPTEIVLDASKGEPRIATPLGIFKTVEASSLPFAPKPQQEITMVLGSYKADTTFEGREGLPETARLPLKEVIGRFENLDELIKAVLPSASPQNLLQLMNSMPQPDTKMASGIMFLLSAITGGRVRKLFSDNFDAVTDTAQHTQSAVRALTEMSGGLEQITDKNGMRWQSFYVPVFDGHNVNQLALHVSRDNERENRNDGEKTDDTRFVFDLRLSHLGRMQVDGLLQGKKNIDVVVRTGTQLPSYMKTEMHYLFANAMELTGMKGSIAFFITREFAAEAAPPPPSESVSEGVVV